MAARKNKKRMRRSFYKLSEVRQMIDEGSVRIHGNALDCARRDFGWEAKDILRALSRLEPKHFHKSDSSKAKPGVVLDFYKAPSLGGESVYTHFYIDDEERVLVVNSFKECR